MSREEIHSEIQLMELIQEIGFLPLLDSGIRGFSAEDMVDDDCRYVMLPDGGWDWPLWKWKGPVVTEGNCVYGKFFNKKAGFISREWWSDFYNYRRHVCPIPQEGSIDDAILMTLRENGSMITRELRAACGFTGTKMRSKFDGYITRLQMGCYIITEDFVYPHDRHGREYGWGWSLLTTPEQLLGKEACRCSRTAEESLHRMFAHLRKVLPNASDKQIERILV
ncbi:MAG: hypothetical protein J5867_11275 [Prevotella sp.]|nr:hypothetical protein [Prevotella sp.]